MVRFITIVAGIILLYGCNSRSPEVTPEEDISPVHFGTMSTKVTGSTWENADRLAIYSKQALTGSTPATSTAGITHVYTAGVWSPISASNKWYWANAVTTHNFYAYYSKAGVDATKPYTAIPLPNLSAQSNPTSIIPLATLQNTYEFLRASPVSAVKGTSVKFTMKRSFAAIKIKMSLLSGVLYNLLTSATFTGSGIVNSTGSTINLETGAISGTKANSLVITPTNVLSLDLSPEISAIILPTNSQISVSFSLKSLLLPIKATSTVALPQSEYQAGNVYTFTANVKLLSSPLSYASPHDPSAQQERPLEIVISECSVE